MKHLNVYLHFNGNARQALEFYKHCFGGEILSLQTYANSPLETKDQYRDMIMHSEFKADHIEFMAGDAGEHQAAETGTGGEGGQGERPAGHLGRAM